MVRHSVDKSLYMKKPLLFIIALFTSASFCCSQTSKITRDLTPVKGYYKSLQVFSPQPKSDHEEIDRQKFPYDVTAAEKRLSLKPYYLENIKLSDFKMPDPPANSSEQTRAELNYLLSLQQQRTKLDIESSMHLAGVYYNIRIKPEDSSYNSYRQNLFHVGRTLGTWFNPKDLPLTANLIANVWRDASYLIWGFKYKYLRVRPYVLEKDLQNLEETNWAAYPSGHAANSYINAYIYQELAPEFSEVFLKDAYDMAHSREIIGVHYPSDSEASRVLARQFVNRLFQNEKFLKDFELVKKEWAEKAKESFIKPTSAVTVNPPKAASCGAKQPTACAKTCQ
jgi:acid phosphatase (class A)